MATIKEAAFSGIKWQSLSALVVAIAKLLQVAIITRFISKNDLGLVGVALLLNGFCAIFVDMGFASAVLHNQSLTKKQFSSFYWLNVITGMTLALLVGMSAPLIADYYRQEDLIGIVSFTSILIFTNSLYALQRTMQQKLLNFRFISAADMSSVIIVIISTFIFCYFNFGVYSYVWASLLGSIFLALLYLIKSVLIDKSITCHISLSEIKDGMKIGLYQVGSSSLDFLSREMDSLIISSSFSMELFGIYSICKQLALHVYGFINPIVTNVLTPVMAKLQDNKVTIRNNYIKSVRYLGFVNFPVYAIIAYASYSILYVIYGPSYSEYAFVLLFLSFFYAIQSLGNPSGALLIATGRTDLGFIWTIYRIAFTSLYLYIASRFSFFTFCVLVFFTPLFTLYPSWYITLRKVIDLKFYENVFLIIKPLSICAAACFLYFVPSKIDLFVGLNSYLNQIIRIAVITFLFFTEYMLLNYLFRKQLFMTILFDIRNGMMHR